MRSANTAGTGYVPAVPLHHLSRAGGSLDADRQESREDNIEAGDRTTARGEHVADVEQAKMP